MSDHQRINRWKRIKTPRGALREIVENEMFFGFDPYYADLRAALLEMAKRVLEEAK